MWVDSILQHFVEIYEQLSVWTVFSNLYINPHRMLMPEALKGSASDMSMKFIVIKQLFEGPLQTPLK